MWSWESVVGAIVAVILAGMPAMLALLKINELHGLITYVYLNLSNQPPRLRTRRGSLKVGMRAAKRRRSRRLPSIQDATDLAKKLLAEAAEKARVIIAGAAEKAHQTVAEAPNEALEK